MYNNNNRNILKGYKLINKNKNNKKSLIKYIITSNNYINVLQIST